MSIDETISTSIVSVGLGIVIGVAVEATLPPYRVSDASTAELAFESAVQIAMLSVHLSGELVLRAARARAVTPSSRAWGSRLCFTPAPSTLCLHGTCERASFRNGKLT